MQSNHSSRVRRALGALAAVSFFAGAAGCRDLARPAREEDHPLMRQALALDRAGNVDGAIEAYQRMIDVRPRAARAHLNVAILYNQPPKEDFLRAIYHFERYIDLRPTAENVSNVRDLARRAQLMYGAGLSTTPSNEMLSIIADQRREAGALRQQVADQRADIAKLRQQVADQQKEIAELMRRAPAAPAPAAGSAPAPRQPAVSAAPLNPSGTLRPPTPAPAPGLRTHVVQPGETLSSIANRVYNDPSAWRKIFDANRDILDNPAAVRPGQHLAIP